MIKEKFKNITTQNGITLISLIITIIILLILAGVTLNLTIGENEIFKLAGNASKNYMNAQDKELADLENLYSSMLIATNDNSQITINVEDLKNIIKKEVNEQLNEKYLYYTFTLSKSGSGTSSYEYSNYFTPPSSSEYTYFWTTWSVISGGLYAETWNITPIPSRIYIYSTNNNAFGTLQVTVCYKKIDTEPSTSQE